jgi:hypothetical protein
MSTREEKLSILMLLVLVAVLVGFEYSHQTIQRQLRADARTRDSIETEGDSARSRSATRCDRLYRLAQRPSDSLYVALARRDCTLR